MNNLEEKLTQCAREIRETYVLKKDERIRISDNILSETTHAAIPSPYHKVRFPHFLFMNYGSIALLFVLVSTGILSFAAESSLPGDALYNVKTNFNENLQSLLTVSPGSKAKLQADLTKKRLQEAEQLAAADRLSTSTEKTLAVNFQKHFDDFKQSINEVTKQASSTPSVSDATSSDAKIAAYASLKKVSAALEKLDGNLGSFSTSTVATSSPITASTTDIAAIATSTDVEATSTATTTAATSNETFKTTFTIETKITEAQSIANDGIELLGNGEYEKARAAFDKAFALLDTLKLPLPLENSSATSTATNTESSQ